MSCIVLDLLFLLLVSKDTEACSGVLTQRCRKHIRDSMEITKMHKIERGVEHARNLFKLFEALLQDSLDDSQVEAVIFREEVEIILKKTKLDIAKCDSENAYDNVVPIFWR